MEGTGRGSEWGGEKGEEGAEGRGRRGEGEYQVY